MEGSYDTNYVCKHGIAYDCDVYPRYLMSDTTRGHEEDYKNIKDYDRVYVITSSLPWWLDRIYPKLRENKTKIILITGDSTISSPKGLFHNEDVFNMIIREGVILHWFCQNIDLPECPFMTPIPLGIDYHTIHRKSHWGEDRTHYSVQDSQLQEISSSQRHPTVWNNKKNKVLLDAHLTSHTNPTDRKEAYHTLKNKEFIELLPKRLSRSNFWKHMKDFKFIVSPLGKGIDCHRTWEAIILGVVPIVKRTSIYPLIKDFPILFVDSYDEINQDKLDSFVYPDNFPVEKLTLSYWKSFIREKSSSIVNPISPAMITERSNKVIVCGCVRNIESYKNDIRETMDHTRTVLENGGMKCDFLWIESDSTDNTVNILSKFSNVISLGSLASHVKDRTQRIATCRNRYIEYVYQYNTQHDQKDHYEYMIVIDPDEKIRIPKNTPEIIRKYIGLSKDDKYAGIFANTERYYDVWALRSKECNYDCWLKVKTTPGTRIEKYKNFVGKHQIHIPQDSPPYEVDSTFNGLGIYWIPSLIGTYYNGHQLIQVQNNKIMRLELCEHVHLNTILRNRGEKLAIIPELYIGNIGQEHIIQ